MTENPHPPTADEREPTPEELDLMRLADGTLPPARRAEVEARVAASPELAALVADQHRGRELVADAPPAPARLRTQLRQDRVRSAPAARRRRLGFVAGLTVAATALAVTVTFLLPSDVPGGTVIASAAELQALPAEAPAPPPASRTLLDKDVLGVPFPNYTAKFGWRAVGQREDVVHGRRSVAVFYQRGGRRVGYSILTGDAVEPPPDARRAAREGTLLRSFEVGGRVVVTWEREGRTCVMSAVGVPRDTLYDLAGWKGKGTIPF